MSNTTELSFAVSVTEADAARYTHVIQDAVRIHCERENVRRGLWKEYPAQDQIFQIKVKADRVKRTLDIAGDDPLTKEEEEHIRGELLDIINYSVFAVRKLGGETA